LILSRLTATALPSTLSLHDALPISPRGRGDVVLGGDTAASGRPEGAAPFRPCQQLGERGGEGGDVAGRHQLAADAVGDDPGNAADRKSTRLNSSHVKISYAVFCLKK